MDKKLSIANHIKACYNVNINVNTTIVYKNTMILTAKSLFWAATLNKGYRLLLAQEPFVVSKNWLSIYAIIGIDFYFVNMLYQNSSLYTITNMFIYALIYYSNKYFSHFYFTDKHLSIVYF